MSTKDLNLLDSVVKQDLCIGCGACVYQNNSDELVMDWNREGFLVPTQKNNTTTIVELALKVCPFNPLPSNEVRTEDELSNIFLKEAPRFHSQVGRYFNTHVGYSEQFRLTSSSGGLATYILNELFEQGMIDAAITVGEGRFNHYEYKLIRSKQDILATSKTKYYPVTMAEALNQLNTFKGKVAVIGIGCFIKAIRLLQYYNPELQEKIVFTIGIICGGLKSKFFGEYLAAKAGVKANEFIQPQFRIKDYNSNAGDYSFGCKDKEGNEKQVKMHIVGDMWGTGMFKCNACDFCDDVTTELADVSLGDAWIHPYDKDGKGTNVIVTRSKFAESLINEGFLSGQLDVKPLPFEVFLFSQQGSFNHRHKGLLYRIKRVKKNGNIVPPKRHTEKITLDFKLVQELRRVVRKNSLLIWSVEPIVNRFEKKMRIHLKRLKDITLFYHFKRALLNKIGW